MRPVYMLSIGELLLLGLLVCALVADVWIAVIERRRKP